MLEGAPEAPLGPAQALPPEPAETPDRFLPHFRVECPRNSLAGQRSHATREVDVLGQRRRPPASRRGQQLPPDHDPVAAELGAAAHRPATSVQLAVHVLLVRLSARQPAGVGVEDLAPGGHRVRAGREIACGTAQKAGLDPRVGIENQDHISTADIGLGSRQGGAFPVWQAVAFSPDHACDPLYPEFPSCRRDDLAAAVDRAIVHDDQLEERLPSSRPIALAGHVAHESWQHFGFVTRANQDRERGRRRRGVESLRSRFR